MRSLEFLLSKDEPKLMPFRYISMPALIRVILIRYFG
jgi:hypothetical protein